MRRLPASRTVTHVALVVLMLGLSLVSISASAAPDVLSASPVPAVDRRTCDLFPSDNYWHADIRTLPVHPSSDTWLAHMSPTSSLHPDFGPQAGPGPDYGIPLTYVGAGQAKVRVRFEYAAESDRVPYPFGPRTRIEGGRRSDGDRHAIVIDTETCRLYETWNTHPGRPRWYAGSGATWDLRSNALRPDGWTSADAAGLPIAPGLLRWREVRDGRVDHAIRFTTDRTARSYIWPARHQAGSTDDAAYPPMGARFRLKDSWTAPADFSPQARTVVAAMQTYGLVLADNGSPWFFQGEQHRAWPDRLIADLKRIPAAEFEAVDTEGLKVDPNSAAVR